MKIIAAFATDNGKELMGRHFGDASFFDIYEIDEGESLFIKRIVNKKIEEKQHADPEKAAGIAGILTAERINTAVSRNFGPNIKRIKKKFVCVTIKEPSIEEAIIKIKDNYTNITSQWYKGEARETIQLD